MMFSSTSLIADDGETVRGVASNSCDPKAKCMNELT